MMLYLAQFHWGVLTAALLLGLAMGWISVVHRGAEMPARWFYRGGALVLVALVCSAMQLLPGRFGYWLDLALLLFAAYLVGCVVGTWLRALLVAHQRRRRESAG